MFKCDLYRYTAGTPAAALAETALSDALRLIRMFPEYLDVVVSVARKTDSRDWPALFEHAGDPGSLQRDALKRGQLRTAVGLHSPPGVSPRPRPPLSPPPPPPPCMYLTAK